MGIFEKLSEYLARERNLAEVQSMTERDLADLALELQALREAILARPKVREQMLEMAARFGLTEDDITHTHWREMDILNACQNCGDAKQCRRFLNGKSTNFIPKDCPNASAYGEIVAEKR
ncbi:MAG: hypothetical protein AAGP08_17110 [Pseudomonadota bacterium]